MFFKKNKKRNFKNGLILMELIVSLGVFIAVMTVGMGAVLQMFGINQKSQSLKTIMNNLNFAIDSMAREIVVAKIKDTNENGSSLRCNDIPPMHEPDDCPIDEGGGDYISFCTSEGNAIAYRFVVENAPGGDTRGSIERKISVATDCPTSFGSENWQRITSPEVNVEELRFFVSGAGNENPASGKQPKVLLIVKGEAGKKDDVKSKFNIQTTLSQRTPDLSSVLNP